jgi:putative hydroxymethylpyrimidine transport system substrate-binding protein
MKKSLLMITSTLIILLSACGQSENASTDELKGSGEKLLKVSLMLDWYPNAVHSFLYTAVEKGYFLEQGLEVDIQMPSDTNDPLKLVAADKVDMAISYQPQVLVARGEDIPVVSFAALVRHPLNQLIVPIDGGIQSPKDLEGKAIGYPSIPLNEAIIQTMIESDGGKYDKVKMVDVGWDLIPAIATKNTDALIGAYINHEKLILEKEGHPVRTIDPVDYGVPDYYELVLVSSENGLKEKADVFKKFTAAITKGQNYVVEHPKEALSILLNHENQSSPLDEDIERKSLEMLIPLMDSKNQPFGYQEPSIWENVAQWLYETNITKKKVEVEEAFTNF